MTFAQYGLDPRLLKSVAKLGLEKTTPIQDAVIPVVLTGRDIQASAKTGSGKSAAFFLPLLHLMLAHPAPRSATRCLVLSPTRELAIQLEKHCRDLAQFTDITAQVVIGGTGLKEQQARLRKNPEIVIGTPGRILEHVQKKSLELGELEFLVLDEVDRILDMGMRDEVLAIVEHCRQERQTLMLSATLDHRELGNIAKTIQKSAQRIVTDSHRSPHDSITQEIILADDNGHKQQLCNWLLANEQFAKALVFTNTRVHAEELAGFLIKQGQRAACLHGEMPPHERKRIMRLFRDGKVAVLVSTDLAARGLDVPEIDLVINFAMARGGDEYVHRIGRTGRAGATGKAISLIAPQEWNRMESIARYLAVTFTHRKVAELPSRFTGQTKKKKPGKPVQSKRRDGPEDKAREKARQRHRVKKNIGKRRIPGARQEAGAGTEEAADKGSGAKKAFEGKAVPARDGFAPVTRKK